MNAKSILRHFGARSKYCTAIILAGGNGSRMNSSTTKQFIEIKGLTVVARSIMAFEACKDIKEIIIVAKQQEAELYRSLIQKYAFKKIKHIVCGGSTRQESAFNGFIKISDKCDYVAIHDAARCLVTPANIKAVLDSAVLYGAASAAVPVKDTVKITDSKGFVSSTPDRARVWQAQTPQIFKADLYRAAAYYAKKEGFEGTDDNSLVEWLGAKVKLVNCGYKNIKITTPEDVHIANILLKEAEE